VVGVKLKEVRTRRELMSEGYISTMDQQGGYLLSVLSLTRIEKISFYFVLPALIRSIGGSGVPTEPPPFLFGLIFIYFVGFM